MSEDTIEMLQALLDRLITLKLSAKHLHWVVTGRTFQMMHELLDELVAVLDTQIDNLAERMVYLGIPPSPYEGEVMLPHGTVQPDYTAHTVAGLLDKASEAIDECTETDDFDLSTEDVLIEAQREIDKYQWFFRSHV